MTAVLASLEHKHLKPNKLEQQKPLRPQKHVEATKSVFDLEPKMEKINKVHQDDNKT